MFILRPLVSYQLNGLGDCFSTILSLLCPPPPSAQSVSTLLFPSPAMFAPSVIPRHVNRSQSSLAVGFNPQLLPPDFLLFPPQRRREKPSHRVPLCLRTTALNNPHYVHFVFRYIQSSTIAPCLLSYFIYLFIYPQSPTPTMRRCNGPNFPRGIIKVSSFTPRSFLSSHPRPAAALQSKANELGVKLHFSDLL